MLKLSDFVGELVANVSEARFIADAYSLRISEQYHADPFLKSISIPHYTIEEAEMTVPVSIVGRLDNAQSGKEIKEQILEVTAEKLHRFIFTKIWEIFRDSNISQSNTEIESYDGVKSKKASTSVETISQKFTQSSHAIAKKIYAHISNFIDEVDIKALKLLEIMDIINVELEANLLEEFKKYSDEYEAFGNEILVKKITKGIRGLLVNEYRDILEDWHGILVNPITGKMNEYASQESLTYIKLKIKEQDFDFIVEEDPETGKSKRFLSNS